MVVINDVLYLWYNFSMTRKRKNLLAWLAILFITVASVVITVALAVNIGETTEGESGPAFRLDWIEVMCSLLSGAASVILGVVAMVQTEKANKLTEELAEIDRFQYENSVMSQDCPLIKFAKVQEVDNEERELVLRFVDTKNMSVKSIYVNGACLYPYLRGDREDEAEPVLVQRTEHAVKAKFFKYRHRRRGLSGYYEAQVKCDPEALGRYKNFLLEFDLGIVNETGVANVYKYKLLIKGETGKRKSLRLAKDSGDNKHGSARKVTVRRLRVMHQFYEIETMMGEEKFREEME